MSIDARGREVRAAEVVPEAAVAGEAAVEEAPAEPEVISRGKKPTEEVEEA